MKNFLSKLTLLLSTCLVITQFPPASGGLPDLGNEYRRVLSLEDEILIGESWVQNLHASQRIHQDPLVNHYVRYIGNRLANYVSTPGIKIDFFVVEDKTINAFAFLGGNVAVHDSLILMTENESELAAVMAHELAHVQQHHILRAIAKNRNLLPITMAEALAAVVLGVPDLIVPVLAGHGQQMINFTRENEKEADRIGMQILSKAQFDPQGMPNVFERMSKHLRYNSRPPEYLLTHPIYESRISETRHRADQFSYHQAYNPLSYYFIKARLEVQKTKDIDGLIATLQKRLQENRYNDYTATEYALALALQRRDRNTEAWEIISRLQQQNPTDPIINYTASEIRKTANPQSAFTLLAKFQKAYPDHPAILLEYAELALRNQKPKLAKSILLSHEKLDSKNPQHYILLRRTEGMLNNRAAVHAANAEWYTLHGDISSALKEINTAMSFAQEDKKYLHKLQTRKEELEAYMVALKAV